MWLGQYGLRPRALAINPHGYNYMYYQRTIFIQILAAATINFSLAGVRLLIEGGSYLRAN